MLKNAAFILFLLLACGKSFANRNDSLPFDATQLPVKFFETVQKKYSGLEERLSKKTFRYLKKMQKQEKALLCKMPATQSSLSAYSRKIDSLYAAFGKQQNR